MSDTTSMWIVQRAGVVPRTFLTAEHTWGTAATAERFESEEAAMLTPCPDGSTGLPMRLTYHPHRAM
jgi:hypothetical protein